MVEVLYFTFVAYSGYKVGRLIESRLLPYLKTKYVHRTSLLARIIKNL